MSDRRWRGRRRALAAIGAVILLGACAAGTDTSTSADTPSGTTTSKPTSTSVGARGAIIIGAADTVLYMDTQEYELREVLADSGVIVERAQDDVILRMPGAAAFEPEQAEIKPGFRASVAAAALVLRIYDRTLIEVDGYTDSTGAMERNMALSLERAEAVAQLLKSQGIPDTRIASRGMGPLQPLAKNDTADGRQLNRRVEIAIRPLPWAR